MLSQRKMGTNSMLWNKTSGLAVCLGWLASGSGVASAPVVCPDQIVRHGHTYWLDNASVYDGLPSRTADLEPFPQGSISRWDWRGNPDIDPYLLCRFGHSASVVVFHVPDATVCTFASHHRRVPLVQCWRAAAAGPK